MRCCPKCGDKFEDTDFRTMCPSCMVSLVRASAESASQASMNQSGPVTVGMPTPAPTATISMPTITMPEMRMPDIPTPTLPPEVPARPFTPQPAPGPQPTPPDTPVMPPPDPKQPTVIPTPQPAPQPIPQPQPEPQPIPQPKPLEPVPMGRVIKPAIQPVTVAKPKPAVESDPSTPVQRTLTADEINSARSAAAGMGFAAAICGFILLIALFNISAESFGFFTLIFFGGWIALVVFLTRQAIFRYSIHNIKVTIPGPTRLGSSLRFEVAVGVLRTLPVTGAELTITATERAQKGSGDSKKVSTHTIFTRTIPIKTPANWQAGKMLVFRPQMPLPAEAMPTFQTKSNSVQWSAALWVGIPGWYPDIRQRVPLTIPALREGHALPPSGPQDYSLPELGDLSAALTLECPLSATQFPIFPAGQKIPFRLQIAPQEKGENSKISLELSYRITGSGDTEQVTVDHVECFRRGWQAGIQQQEHGFLTVPADSPITYDGTHIHVVWLCTVRQELSWRRDRRQIFEVLVTPADAGE